MQADDPIELYVPAGHAKHPLPPVEYVPAKQAKHEEALELRATEDWPAGHIEHKDEPTPL